MGRSNTAIKARQQRTRRRCFTTARLKAGRGAATRRTELNQIHGRVQFFLKMDRCRSAGLRREYRPPVGSHCVCGLRSTEKTLSGNGPAVPRPPTLPEPQVGPPLGISLSLKPSGGSRPVTFPNVLQSLPSHYRGGSQENIRQPRL